MAQLQKRIRKIIQNPKGVDFADLRYVLIKLGCTERQPKSGSSHYIYKRKGDNFTISIPKKNPIKENYVKNVIELLGLEDY